MLASSLATIIGKKSAGALIIFLGVSYAIWAGAVDGHAAGSSVLFFSLLVNQLIKLNQKSSAGPWSILRLSIGSLLYVGSHGLVIFHIPAVFYWLKRRFNFRTAFTYAALSLAGIAGLEIGLYLAWHPSFSCHEFLTWVGGYATGDGLNHIASNGFWAMRIKDILAGLWWGWHNSFIISTPLLAVRIFSSMLGVVLAGIVLSSAIAKTKIDASQKELALMFLIWGSMVLVFLSFWGSGFILFRIHILLPLCLGAALVNSNNNLFLKSLLTGAAILFLFNFSGPIYKDSFIQNNRGYKLMGEVRSHLNPGDTFLCGLGTTVNNVDVLGPYFYPDIRSGTLPGRLFARKEVKLTVFSEELDKRLKNNSQIYFAEDLYAPSIQSRIEADRFLEPGSISEFLEHFSAHDSFVLSSGLKIKKAALPSEQIRP